MHVAQRTQRGRIYGMSLCDYPWDVGGAGGAGRSGTVRRARGESMIQQEALGPMDIKLLGSVIELRET
eukprot:9145185-Pyramimonas_sp.AAC.1